MESETIEIVDIKGKVIGKSSRSTAYSKGLLHKAVNIVILNKKRQIYLQQRSKNKSSFPLFWDISVSEHIKPNESYKEAALRGINEELSIETVLKKIRGKHIQRSQYKAGNNQIIEYELVELYAGKLQGKIGINESEVRSGVFLSLEKIQKGMQTNKINFTPWAIDEINFLLNNFKTLKLF